MRHLAAALAALTLIACTAEQAPPRERVTLEKIIRTTLVASKPEHHPAKGNIFVIVHLTEDPPSKDDRRWMRSTIEDWDGRTYKASFSDLTKGESEAGGGFGRRIKTFDPSRIRIVFEVPETSALRGVTVPQSISLFEKPVRISDPKAVPKVVQRVNPLYPGEAHRLGIVGLVKLEVLVLQDGTVIGVRHIHGPSLLGDAAADAVRQWKYEPVIVDGKAVPALFEVHITFHGDA